LKTIVITGASGGIGAALAVRLGAAGHRVALAARRENELRDVASRAGGGAIVVPTDVTRRADVERLRDRAIAEFGHIDVWINNAGRGITRRVLDLSDEDFDGIMSVNVKSAIYGMQASVPHFMERGRGHVINVSSFLSRVPFATYRSAYNAAKAALNALTANLRVDLAAAHPGIHVSLVMPGLVTTDFGRNAVGGSPPLPPDVIAQAQTADEVAAAIHRVIDDPVAELYTNPNHRAVAVRYFQDVGAFEREAAARR
jgi:NAD(P)-dependent dehydrogenase (short-subunit alcohol dehydrogenase family)